MSYHADEALEEFEKSTFRRLWPDKTRISPTTALGIHRNTISKRVNSYRTEEVARRARDTGNPRRKTH